MQKMSSSNRFYRSDQYQPAHPVKATSMGLQQCTYPTKLCRIQDLAPHLQRTVITGLVIVKNSPRLISNKQGLDRFVMNFTLRDSPQDSINATCWGSEEFVVGLSNIFTIGDVVEVRNSEIRLITPTDQVQYRPKASSPFHLTVNESFLGVCLCRSSEGARMEAFISKPLWSPCKITSLADVQRFNKNENLREQRVNILVSIKKVGIARELVSSKTGLPFVKCDVVVFDQSLDYFVIQLWDAEWIQYARKWTPKDCVVLVQDLKLTFDDFRGVIVGTADGRTIFVSNPEMREALMLYTFTQSMVMSEDASDDCVDLEGIHDVYTVEGIKRRVIEAETKGPFRGILFACFTRLDLDGDSFLTSVRCSICKRILDASVVPSQCTNLECPAGAGHEVTHPFTQFDISVALTDHADTLDRGRLTGYVAESLLGCTVEEFLRMNTAQRTKLKWKFLLERCKCYFQATINLFGRGGLSVKLLSVVKAEVPELCAKIPSAFE